MPGRFSACRRRVTATPQGLPLSASLISLCSVRQATSLRWCLELELHLVLRLAELTLVELRLRLERRLVVGLRATGQRATLRVTVLRVTVLCVTVLRAVELRLLRPPLVELPLARMRARAWAATLPLPMLTQPLSTSC